jgi:hypothetical protein
MQHAVQPRRTHVAHGAHEDKPGEERVQPGTDFPGRRARLVDGAHAAEEHRGVEKGLDPVEPFGPVVDRHPQEQHDEEDEERRAEVAKGAPLEERPWEEWLVAVLEHFQHGLSVSARGGQF